MVLPGIYYGPPSYFVLHWYEVSYCIDLWWVVTNKSCGSSTDTGSAWLDNRMGRIDVLVRRNTQNQRVLQCAGLRCDAQCCVARRILYIGGIDGFNVENAEAKLESYYGGP